MASVDYQYMPVTGALPGDSFEKQTVAFFTQLQEQIDALSNQIQTLMSTSGQDLSTLQQQVTNLQSDVDSLRSVVATAQNTAESARNTALQAKETATNAQNGVVPLDGIVMMQGSVPDENWRLADGQNGTPDLRQYSDGNLVFMKRVAA